MRENGGQRSCQLTRGMLGKKERTPPPKKKNKKNQTNHTKAHSCSSKRREKQKKTWKIRRNKKTEKETRPIAISRVLTLKN